MIIRVTPQVLKDQSNLVLDDIRTIEKNWGKITDLVNGSKSYWEGDASETHIRLFKDVEEEVNKLIGRLKQNPVKPQTMAGVYEVTEGEAEAGAAELPEDLF